MQYIMLYSNKWQMLNYALMEFLMWGAQGKTKGIKVSLFFIS